MANVAAGNGTVTSIAELVAPGTIGGSGAVTFPGGIVLLAGALAITGALSGATSGAFSGNVTAATVNSVPVAIGQGSPSTAPGYYTGVGVPTFSAANGSQYTRFDGTTGATVYYNTSGASTVGTTWSAQLTP